MAKRLSGARQLYLAIANSSDINRKLLGLPDEVQKRFEVQLEGILTRPTARFKGVFGKVSVNLLERDVDMLDRFHDAPASIIEGEVQLLELRLGDLRRIALLSQKSEAPLQFLRFLGRPSLSPRHFLGSIGNFTGDRKISFEDVPDAQGETGRKLLRLIREKPGDYVSGVVRTLKEAFEKDGHDDDCAVQEVAAFITDEAGVLAVLREGYPDLYGEYRKHLALLEAYKDRFPEWENNSSFMAQILLAHYGLLLLEEGQKFALFPFHRHCTIGHMKGYVIDDESYFRRRKIGGFARGNIMGLRSDSPRILQHELQHLFDTVCAVDGNQAMREYRAKLAELVFSDSPEDVYRTMRSDAKFGDFEAMIFGGSSNEPHRVANQKIIAAMRGLGIRNSASGKEFRGAALRLLNEAYKKACGLTYDQIIEPFRKEAGQEKVMAEWL